MASVEQGPVSNRLVERVKNILFSSNTEWDVIDAEPATIPDLYKGYICILAAIGPVAQMIGSIIAPQYALWGGGGGVVGAVANGIVTYVLTLVGVYVTAVIIDALAPSFGGQRSLIQAFKVATYSSTAAWIVGVFAIFPLVSALRIIGFYSLYLLYLGLPKLMKAPEDKALVYTLVTIVVAVVVYVVVGVIAGAAVALTVGMGALAVIH